MLITELGYFALVVAFVIAILQVVLPTVGILHNNIAWQRLAPSLAGVQFCIFTGCNQWHRHQDRNRMKEGYRNVETVVAVDYNWTATCRFADIVLPACTPFERNDLDAYGSYSNRGVIAMHKLIDPLYDSKSDFDIWREFTKRMRRDWEYSRQMDEMQWVEHIYEDCRADNLKKDFFMPPFADFWKKAMCYFQKGRTGFVMRISVKTLRLMP